MQNINIQTNIFQIPNFTISQKAADRPPDQLTKEKLLLYLINTKVIFAAIILLHFSLQLEINAILEPNDPKKIGIDGIERLCQDLELDPVSETVLA